MDGKTVANEKRRLAEALKKYHDAQFTPGVYEHSIFGKAALLLEADSGELVRCKDCKHREDGLCTLESVYDYPWYYTKDDDFCSYGERRTDNVC